MKARGKRILSLLLTLCMLISVLPPVVFASTDSGTELQPVEVTFDFTLDQSSLTNSSGASFAGGSLLGTANQGAIAGHYANGDLNWNYAYNNAASFQTSGNTAQAMLMIGGGSNPWTGLRFGVKVTENGSSKYPIGHWTALTVNMEAAGQYDLTLNYMTRAGGAGAGEIYVLPGTYASADAIDAALLTAQKLGPVDFSSTSKTAAESSAKLGKAEFAAGENTVVFKATGYRTGTTNEAYLYLRSLEAVLADTTQTEPLEQTRYDFSRANFEAVTGTSYLSAYLREIPNQLTSDLYTAGQLNWRLAASNFEAMVTGDVTRTVSYLGFGSATGWSGLRLAVRAYTASADSYATGHWFAFNLASPGAGTYEAVLNYQTRKDANRDVKVYLLEGELTDTAAIQTAMDSADSLTSGFESHKDNDGNANTTTNTYADASVSLGSLELKDSPYTLVIHSAGTTGSYFFLDSLDLTEKAEEETTIPEETTAPEQIDPIGYSFELGASELKDTDGAPMAGGNLTNEKILSALEQYYANGVVSWKYAMDNMDTFKTDTNKINRTYYISGTTSYIWQGLRLGVKVTEGSSSIYPAGYWTAFTLKSPGAGNYEISLDYQTRYDSTPAGEVYLIKGTFTDAATLEAAMTRDNLRAVIDFTSKDKTFSAPVNADLGVAALEQGEYTVVFKAAKPSASGSYMHIKQLNIVPTDKSEEAPELPEEEKPVVATPQGFNFELGSSTLRNTIGGSFAGGTLLNTVNLDALEQYYKDGYISWKYALDNVDSFKTESNKVAKTFYFGGGDYKWDGLRLGMSIQEGDTKTYPGGYWAAFTITPPGVGTYSVTLDYQVRGDSTTAGEVYLIKGTFTDTAALEAQMTQDNLLKSVDFKGKTMNFADASRKLGTVTFEAGEYTLVFKAAAGHPSGSYMHINALKFTETALKELGPVQTDKLVYDFQLGGMKLSSIDGTSFAGQTLNSGNVTGALADYFDEQELYWKYAADNVNSFKTADNTVSNYTYIGGTDTYKWNGIRFGVRVNGPQVNPETGKKVATYPEGLWTAMQIHSPGEGVYHLTLDYQTRADSTTAAQIYLIKGALTDPAQIEEQMTADNLIKSVNMKSKKFELQDKQTYLGGVSFEKGEYTLVFKAAESSGNNGAYMFLTKLTADITPPPEPTEIVYDFDLQDKQTGIYTGKKELREKEAELAQMYAKGELNWMYYGKAVSLTDTGHAFNNIYGLSMYTMEGHWMAFKIKSPGAGIYTLTLNHAISGNGGLGAVYLLPGNTAVSDIEAVMDHSNRAGKVEFYNETGTTPVVDGSTSTIGTWNFEKDREYILVFEAYDNSPFKSNYAYMWISQLIAKKGDHTVQSALGSRKIKSIVVDESPCKTMEPTHYMTTSEVNGQDYVFMPVEGKKMYIFNLEDMTKVREVSTPFTTCRGITTDADGMIWMVGDASVVYRYDPYTNTGISTYNYKLSGGIEDSTSGFSLDYDEQGNLYFGTYSKGYVVKYDPKADKFSKVAGTINSDASYSCGVTIKDGYLFAGLTGDRNGDGVKTAEVVKVDLKTNQVVARTDVSHILDHDEVMIRGAGICGKTLFMGGITYEGFIALDIDTMELKDYGIPNQISFAPTEEIDGKCYLVITGYGLYEYDSATDKLTKVTDMDTATIGFRAQQHSSVTISDNPLFPGISYVTLSTSTGLKIYNMQTKQVLTPVLYDKENDGAGQSIRTIIRGEEGDDCIYVGGYNTVNCAKINTLTGERTIFEATSAQTDSMLWYEGSLYTGNYNAGNITRINFDDEERNVILLTMKSLYNQARVHCLAAGDGMIIGGTTPYSYSYGGVLAIVDLKTQARTVEENLVENQCITSVTYHDGIIIGGTSVSGGTGTAGSATGKESAVIFAYDVAKKEKIAELDLRKIFPELPDQLPYIDGIIADPNIEENGKYWGVISETLFSFTFDKTTNTFSVKEELSFGKSKMPDNNGRYWQPCNFGFDDAGYMYVAFGDNGGMRKINMENPRDNELINCELPRYFTIGPDGNLYYSCNNAILKMYPLNVTEDDWLAAEAVDALILAIGKKVTLDSEEKILAAQAAYDALPLKHRALVQQLELLEIAQTDLLEAKIDAIGEVTLDKRAEIEAMLATYEAMTATQKKYVKNYQILNAADLVLQELINKAAAEAMQKIIDAIKDPSQITLEDEAQIRAIRAQYAAMLFLQRQLVDLTRLEAAEAKITELRQERIEHLKQLIASIGDVTLEDEPVIVEAAEIFDWLTLDEREQVDYTTLNAAEKTLKKLQKAAAEEVDALIEAIGTVGLLSGKAVKAARAAYDALTPGSQAYVELLDVLTAAEAAYAAMHWLRIAVIAVIAVVAAGGGAATAIVLKKKRKAVPAKETESAE